jgi:TRIAD3 protein (E3 ubiquitin-protein ligase RNF216)
MDTLAKNNNRVFETYLALDKIAQDPKSAGVRTKTTPDYQGISLARQARENVKEIDPAGQAEPDDVPAVVHVVRAMDLARRVCQAKKDAEMAKKQAEEAEKENFERARAEGAIAECGCCCEEFPYNRMVYCDSDALHRFCIGCAKRMAQHAIGSSQYILTCMSMDGCKAGFSMDQRRLFLDEHMAKALDKIEQEHNLRMAGIENLVSCPFCDFAAEYPPVEENREFKCENPDCGIISCRLCREETHIPKTCEENRQEKNISARHELEEAMSAALIRKCNKCEYQLCNLGICFLFFAC